MTRSSIALHAESTATPEPSRRRATQAATTPVTLAPSAVHAASMRAVLQSGYGTTDVFRIGTTARPNPGPGEVLVRVAAAGLDRGTWHLMTGRPYLMRIMGFGFRAPKEPVPGLDLAGTVVEVGPGVTRFRVGDEVFGIGRGTFAELTRAREDKLVKKPAVLTFDQAAVLAVSGGTAVQAIEAVGVTRGERVLVIGASGGVGTYAVQIAKAVGASVTGVASAGKLATVRTAGADRVIDYTAEDFADGSATYDAILDVGGGTSLRRLRRALTPTGRLVFVGNEYGGDWTAGFGRQLLALALSPFVRQRFVILAAKEHHSHLEKLAAFVDLGQVAPVIDRRVPLAGLVPALHDLEAGRIRGKVVIAP
jgi:NADPH:quinone reductase-like Zn-dependent oxidoreductase